MSTNTPITKAEVEQALQDIRRPDFRIWIRGAYVQGQLDLLAQGIMISGKASTNVEAIHYMAEHMKDYSSNGGKVTWGDVSKAPHSTKLQRRLSELVTEEKKYGEYDLSRIHGTISHVAIPELFSGKLINLETRKRRKRESPTFGQMDFFSNGASPDLFLKAAPKQKVKLKIIDQTISLWQELSEEMIGNQNVVYGGKFRKLRGNIIEIFGEYALKILNHRALEDQYLSFLTFMTWAGALASYKISGSFHLFSEIPVFPYNGDFSAGRIDALSVLRINKQSITQANLKVIEKMTDQQFRSVGYLIKNLKNTFKEHLELVIRDWKFAVGDGPKGIRKQVNILRHDEMKEKPLLEHEEQIKRYLSTAVLSYSLASKKDIEDAEKLWESKSFDLKGQIIYLTPDNYPTIHEVTLNPEEIKSVFQEQVVANFTSAERRSIFRRTSNELMNHTIKLFTGNGLTKHKPKSGQLALDEILSSVEVKSAPKNSVSDVVEKYRVRKFKDENQIIEIVGTRKNQEVLEMHLDRLFKGIDDGKVSTSRGFNLSRGGHINCLIIDEKTPSMYISFSRGRFKCFSCGAHGEFAPLSIPEDVQTMIKPGNLPNRDSATRKLVIPGRHQEIMLAAQEVVQQNFLKSQGVSYLAKVRGLDPEISLSLGAGFADENLISGLLDRGFNFAEMVQYGFLGISTSIREDSKIVEIFRKRGHRLEDITRAVFTKQKGEEYKKEKGLPYSVLDGRVTYPLEVRGIINSFYGRSIDPNCPKGLLHRKLSTEHTNMPHGGFNLTKAINSGASQILVTEGTIDADTFFQKSDIKEVAAIIGVNNQVLWEELAEFSGDIIIAFDNDAEKTNDKGVQTGRTGQRNTIALSDALRAKGFQGAIYDFTAGFLKKNPNVKYKDTNKYWLDYQKPISVLESIKNA